MKKCLCDVKILRETLSFSIWLAQDLHNAGNFINNMFC